MKDPPQFLIIGSISEAFKNRSLKRIEEYVMIENYHYKVIGISLHATDHYVACIKSNVNGWLFYDGIHGYLVKFEKKYIEKYIPTYVVYMKMRQKTHYNYKK